MSATANAADKQTVRLQRRNKLLNVVLSRLTLIRTLLFIVGYGWLLLLPYAGLSRRAWIDENALQPGQVNVDWNWGDVKAADTFLEGLEAVWNANGTAHQRAEHVRDRFREMGLEANTQDYWFDTPRGDVINGTNAYALSRSSRSSGTEAMVIAASWISRQDEGVTRQPNLRGIASVLALAQSLSRQHVWAKDLVFLISDGYLDGAHAWLSAYHGSTQSGMRMQPLVNPEPSGVVWTAIVLDYPGHSFSHLGLFFEGTNARLPNQDLSNSASTISQIMGVPWVLYDHSPESQRAVDLRGRGLFVSALLEVAEMFGLDIQDYVRRAANLRRNFGYQATGEPSGIHGVFHKYRIDAITLFGLPARGPHGFHAIGRVTESLLRTTNNLLERLHASFFFYIFTAPGEFLEFAKYLPPVIILGLAGSFGGLKLYVETGWTRVGATKDKAATGNGWVMRDRPVLEVLIIMALTHITGLATLWIVNWGWFWDTLEEGKFQNSLDMIMYPSVLALVTVGVYVHVLYPLEDAKPVTAAGAKAAGPDGSKKAAPVATTSRQPPGRPAPPPSGPPSMPILPATTPALLKALNLCLIGAVVSVLAVANFSLSAVIAATAILPLSLIPVDLHDKGAKKISGVQSILRTIQRCLVWIWITAITPTGLLWLSDKLLEKGVVMDWLRRIMWESAVLKTWFVPLFCVLYLPLVLQGFIVCLLPL